MKISKPCFPWLALLSALGLLSGQAVQASDRWLAVASPAGPTHAPFVLDGIASPLEYSDAWSLARISYPGAGAAGARLIATSSDLYVCLTYLRRGSEYDPSIAVLRFAGAIDSGGAGRDELVVSIDEAGRTQAGRYNPAGPVAADRWGAMARIDGPDRWTAEFRISRSLIPHSSPGERTSFTIDHSNLLGLSVGYGWPPYDPVIPGGPREWGQLLWLASAESGMPVLVDQLRVTHGLEVDLTAGVRHDLIAGKDFIVRAQCYTTLTNARYTLAEMLLQRVSPDVGPLIVRTISVGVTRLLPRTPSGYFDGSPTLDARFPGAQVSTSGRYRLQLRFTMPALGSPVVVDLGTYSFKPTKDLRLLLVPWDDVTPGYTRRWGPDLTALIPVAMDETARMYPGRSGAEIARLFPGSAASGLRYLLYFGGACRSGETPEACDARKRTLANDMLHRLNAMLRTSTDPSNRDRFDFHVVMAGVTNDGGGQMQPWYDPPSSAIFFNPNLRGNNGSLVVQEVGHALGLVTVGSPNSIDGGAMSHSMNNFIPLVGGRPMINFRESSNYDPVFSAMAIGVGTSQQSFLEGFEWNALRLALLAKPDDPGVASLSVRANGNDPVPLYHLVGWIDQQDSVTVLYSETLASSDYARTPPAPNSPYVLRFLGANNNLLGELPFEVGFDREHHGNEPPTTPFSGINLATPVPQNTAVVEIRKSGALLLARPVSAAPPVVGGLTVQDLGGRKFLAHWQASGADVPALRFNVFFLRQEDGLRRLVDAGLTDPVFEFDAALAPATTSGQLIVQATDGFNSAEASSPPFTIAPQPPAVLIDGPQPAPPGRALVESDVLRAFRGYAYDVTDGPLTGQQLSWSSDVSGLLGTGDRPAFQLPAGKHTITLTAKASSGLASSTNVVVKILPDVDHDGLPDEYELACSCLNKNVFDSELDFDGDGLTNLEEFYQGTNPCEADTDADGIADGDEVRLGSRPVNAQSKPAPPAILLSSPQAELDGCPNQGFVTIWTSAPDLKWRATPAADWLTVTPSSGTGSTLLSLSGSCQDLPSGLHETEVMIFSPGQPPASLRVRVYVPPAGAPPALVHGFQNTPLGGAKLDTSVPGQLVLQGIGTSGNDGLRMQFGAAEAVEVRFDSAIGAQDTPTDTSFRLTPVDCFNRSLAEIRGWDIGAGYSTEVRFDPLGSPTYRVRLYAGANLLYEESGRDSSLPLNGGNVILAFQPHRLGLERTPAGGLKIIFAWDSSVGVEVPNRVGQGPVNFSVDRMELTPIAPSPTVAEICGLELRFSHITQRTIVDEALTAFGVRHRGLGSAVISGAGVGVDVSGGGPNLPGGVAIDLGATSAGSAQILPYLSPVMMPTGAVAKVTAVGPMYNPLATLSLTRAAGGFEARRQVHGFAPTKETVQLLVAGNIVAEFDATGNDLGFTGPELPTQFEARITGTGALLLSAHWAAPTALRGQLVPAVNADTLRWVFEKADEFLPGTIEALWVETSGMSGFKVLDALGDASNPNPPIRIIGVLHRPLGNSVPRLDAEANLTIRNLTSSGADGVSVDALGRTLLGLHFDTAIPANQSAPGARSDVAVLDPAGAPLALLSGKNLGAAYETKADFAGVQSGTHRLRVWNGAAQTLDVPGRKAAFYPHEQARHVVVGVTVGGELSATLLWGGVIAIDVAEAQGGFVFGDKLEVLSERNQPNTTPALGSVEMRWSHIGTRVLLATTPRPPTLGSGRALGDLKLQWTEGAGVPVMVLEERDELSPNAQWTPVSPQPTPSNGKVGIAIPPWGAGKFYRLRQLP